jgi:hypothetical protein
MVYEVESANFIATKKHSLVSKINNSIIRRWLYPGADLEKIECESASKRLIKLSDRVRISLQEVGQLGCLPADAQAL